MRTKKWDRGQLEQAAKHARSIRQILAKLGLKEAGGNYSQIKKYLKVYNVNVAHFKGKGWNRGLTGIGKPIIPLKNILVKNSYYQSHKLKNRLIKDKLKLAKCEKCGWAQRSIDGRLPIELDHINGDSHDNRLENLKILCPNCHSLQLTHRGKNRRIK